MAIQSSQCLTNHPITALLDANLRMEQSLCSFKNLPATSCQRRSDSRTVALRDHGIAELLRSDPLPYEDPIGLDEHYG